MIARLAIKHILRGKVRFLCAILGVAAAGGAINFVFSLEATNNAQAPAKAEKVLAPWKSWKIEGVRIFPGRNAAAAEARGKTSRDEAARRLPPADLELEAIAVSVDLRPGGRVLQGPPMRTVVSPSRHLSPYASAALSGVWPEWSGQEAQIAATSAALTRFGRGEAPKLGTVIKFIGEKGTMSARLVGILAQEKTPAGFPGVFANEKAFAVLHGENCGKIRFWRQEVKSAGVAGISDVAPQFMSDAGRNLDRAGPLMLWAAAMTALCLLINSLLLSVEAMRREIAMLRMAGMTGKGVAAMVMLESMIAGLGGTILGGAVAAGALELYVSLETALFPEGAVFSWRAAMAVVACAVAVSALAALCALRPALSVRALEAASQDAAQPVKYRRAGMLVAFACGFGAFVAVEVWGASLMKPFIPSPEWPDAIVSLLPGGVSPYDVDRLSELPGVSAIGELQVLQAPFHPREESKGRGRGGRNAYRNALLMAGKPELMFGGDAPLLPLKIVRGRRDAAFKAVAGGRSCIVTEMMARARGLEEGDDIAIEVRGAVHRLKIAGIADLNWHMVTSRGLVRGLNGMPSDTDGPVFVSFETMYSILPVPSLMSSMTHLWLRYRPDFVREHGVFAVGRMVEGSIAERLGNPSQCAIRLHARDEIADGTMAHGARLIGAMARVPFVFLAVLSIGFVAMLTAFADASRREFEILRTVGATKMQLVLRMVKEAMRVASCGILAGMPCGAVAGWLFTWGTRAAMAHWGLPASFCVPWPEVASGAVGAVLFALLIAAPAAAVLVAVRWRR